MKSSATLVVFNKEMRHESGQVQRPHLSAMLSQQYHTSGGEKQSNWMSARGPFQKGG